MEAVVDANVWLAATNPREPGHDDSVRFLRISMSHRVSFLMPTLALPEVAGTAARKTRDAADGLALARQLQCVPDIRFLDLDLPRAQAAALLASRLFLRGADAQYAALAAEFRIPLVTLDRELHERCATELECMTPGEWIARYADPARRPIS